MIFVWGKEATPDDHSGGAFFIRAHSVYPVNHRRENSTRLGTGFPHFETRRILTEVGTVDPANGTLLMMRNAIAYPEK